ncbi:MAG: SRPBCC family protein [Rhizobacter sp.]|nr:SRPBCC family protein [Rhizobacter sp.]
MTSALAFVVAFCVVALLVYLARYSGRVRVEATRVVDASLAQTRARIVDLRQWPHWSPWLDDDERAVFAGSGGSPGDRYGWRRGDVELGRVEHRSVREPGPIGQRLRLLQLFPLRGVATWQLAEADGKTRVTWTLRGRVAFSMRPFADTLQDALALDFRYGLDRLAGLVEPADAPRYRVTFGGVDDSPALRYAYVEQTVAIDDRGPALHAAVNRLRAELGRHGVVTDAEPRALYVSTRTRARTTTCRFALAIGEGSAEGVDVASVPAHRAFAALLDGSPAELEVAWYLAMRRVAALGLRPDLRLMPSERYLRLPGDAVLGRKAHAERALVEIRIPVLAS